MKYVSLFLFILVLTGCRESKSTMENLSPQPWLKESFQLKVGETARADNGMFVFVFESVPSDSRCPEGAACIWAGDASVVLKFHDSKDTLHTYLKSDTISYYNYRIHLVLLSPYPKISQMLSQSDYIAKLEVTKI